MRLSHDNRVQDTDALFRKQLKRCCKRKLRSRRGVDSWHAVGGTRLEVVKMGHILWHFGRKMNLGIEFGFVVTLMGDIEKK
mmetsp:Transcript_12051/g.23211  ORF Transcript_12051/g.23211 Transcript_12051/m.23211 type:complete len:81 (-) Transcript_12051:192-434(-)